MIRFTQGNLLEAKAEALVNTVNTVGVMGKGIALMFKEAFPSNYKQYAQACKRGEIKVGHVFATEENNLLGAKWIFNFPTKDHWRGNSKLEWIEAGLDDLRNQILHYGIHSVAMPPLGCGNGGLNWETVRPLIERKLAGMSDVDFLVFEPTQSYQNVTKHTGVEKLTEARALIVELVRRYWILGIECSLLEIQKLAWFSERAIESSGAPNTLDLRFVAAKYGPYASRLDHLLNALDGSYLHCDKRLADAGPSDVIWFDDSKRQHVEAYLNSEMTKEYRESLETTTKIIDGFESPLGLELLATVDWLLNVEQIAPTVADIRQGLEKWPGDPSFSQRKLGLFSDRLIQLALDRLTSSAISKPTLKSA